LCRIPTPPADTETEDIGLVLNEINEKAFANVVLEVQIAEFGKFCMLLE
jgi:hypothetical protein